MLSLIAHYCRRFFRGKVVERRRHELQDNGAEPCKGELIQYWSGYVEFVPDGGKPVDVAMDLYLQSRMPRKWRCAATQGTSHFDIHDKTREQARALVAEIGTVIHVDDDHGFIFFKEH